MRMLIYFFMLHPSCLVEILAALLPPKCKDFWSEICCVHQKKTAVKDMRHICCRKGFYGKFDRIMS